MDFVGPADLSPCAAGFCRGFVLRFLLAALAALVAAPASAEWHEARTRHFIIYADAEPAELRDYATKLERFDQAVRTARQMPDPALTDAGRLTIYALKDLAAMDRVLGTGRGIYGVYFPRATGLHAFVAMTEAKSKGDMSADIVFFHEYAHHLMLHGASSAYPPWLVEGFAELLSTAMIDEKGTVTIGSAANHRSVGVFAIDHELTLSAMVGNQRRHLNAWQRELVYARGWLLTHYLTFEPSRKGQLERYVAAVQSGQPALDAAKAAFGDMRELDRELDRYASRKTMSGMIVETDSSKLGEIAIRPLREGEAAVMPARMQTHFIIDRVTAPRIVGRARKVAARYPQDPVVQAIAAEAENGNRNYEAAIAAADRALAADPDNAHALVQKSRAMLELAKQSPATADWNAIRQLLARANRLDTEDPEPLMLFYRTYADAGAAPSASAVSGLLYAVVLAPQDDRLRMTAVRQLLVDGRLAEAKDHFLPIAVDPHGSESDSVAEILAAVESSQVAQAVSLIDAWTKQYDKE